MGLSSSTSWLLFIAYFSLVNPFIEEYFWRGVLGSNTKKFYIGDLVYAGYHALVLWGKVLSIVDSVGSYYSHIRGLVLAANITRR